MYCINGNSSWYSDCGPLFGGCPLLGVSVIGGSTVYKFEKLPRNSKRNSTKENAELHFNLPTLHNKY